MSYNIRYARTEDIDSIMKLFKDYWKDDHILANNKEFFQYEFQKNEKVNFIIAEDEKGILAATLGFIPYSESNPDIMLVMWKSTSKSDPFLGMKLLENLKNTFNGRIVASCGINKNVIPLYHYEGFHVGHLDHYYRLSSTKKQYQLAKISDKTILPLSQGTKYSFVEFDNFEQLTASFSFDKYLNENPKPYKEPAYIKKRYFEHPAYKYLTYGIQNIKGSVNSVIFLRRVEENGSAIFRIVDYIGDFDDLRHISYEIERLICENDLEYIDFYQSGLTETIMNEAGFLKKDAEKNVIPNYFEPFVMSNIDIYYSTTDNDNFVIFKGDGDQDRPNFY